MSSLLRRPLRPTAAHVAALALVTGVLTFPGEGGAQPTATPTGPTVYAPPPSVQAIPKVASSPQTPWAVQPAGTPAMCSAPPTLAQCKSLAWLTSACGQTRQADCKPLLKAEYEAYWNALEPKNRPGTRPMFPFGSQAMARDLKLGKYHGTTVTRPANDRSARYWDLQRASLASTPSTVNPRTYVPHPDWEQNGQAVESCEEYAYEKYYDWQRFQDAVQLCRGNYDCVMDVAYVGGAPGIADRVLKSKAQAALPSDFQILQRTQVAKNAFFANGAYFLGIPNGDEALRGGPIFVMPFAELKAKFPAHAADLEQLKATLENGAVYYGNAAGPGVDEVHTPWGFHTAMRNHTRNVSENEFQEFEARRAELEGYLVGAWVYGPEIPKNLNKWVHPLAEVENVMTFDPFERVNMWRDARVRESYMQKTWQGAALLPHASLVTGVSAVGVKVGGAINAGTVGGTNMTPRSLPAASPKAPMKVYTPVPASAQTFFAPQLTCPDPFVFPPGSMPMQSDIDKANQAEIARHSACKILNLTLREWFRMKAAKAQGGCNDRGSCGCLDLGSHACDWSPKMFYEAYAKQPPQNLGYRRDIDYGFCKKWSFDGFPKIPAASKASSAALEAYLQAKRAVVEAALKSIPQIEGKPGVLGQEFADDATEGDLDSWSAGYAANMGWQVKASDFVTVSGTRKPCQLEAKAGASFLLRLTTPLDSVVGSDVAGMWNHAVDADVFVRANENNNKEARYESHLLIADQEIFATEPGGYPKYKKYDANDPKTYESVKFNYATSRPLSSGMYATRKLTITVWAGPIPLTGSVWAELLYGANAIFEAKMPEHCTANLTSFAAKAGFEPFGMLTGALSVGVGVGGIASAGIRGYLNLITARVPVTAGASLVSGQNGTIDLQFAVDSALELSSLSGRLALYVEFLMYDEEWELFRWNGVRTDVPLLTPVSERFPLGAFSAITL